MSAAAGNVSLCWVSLSSHLHSIRTCGTAWVHSTPITVITEPAGLQYNLFAKREWDRIVERHTEIVCAIRARRKANVVAADYAPPQNRRFPEIERQTPRSCSSAT